LREPLPAYEINNRLLYYVTRCSRRGQHEQVSAVPRYNC